MDNSNQVSSHGQSRESQDRRSEKSRSQQIEEQRCQRVRRKQIRAREMLGKSPNAVFFKGFCIWQARKVGSLKRGRGPFWRKDGPKLARRLAAKHIWKSKAYIWKSKASKHITFGPFVDVATCCESVNQSVSQSVNQSVSQSVSQSDRQSIRQTDRQTDR